MCMMLKVCKVEWSTWKCMMHSRETRPVCYAPGLSGPPT